MPNIFEKCPPASTGTKIWFPRANVAVLLSLDPVVCETGLCSSRGLEGHSPGTWILSKL